jgi:predicted GNAT superfamily acetyltransferase
VGYVFALPTRTPHIQHSHRLAVQPEERGLGLGRRLKWYQREWCLDRGITHVRWTFDPLRLANASLNIHRLGGVAHTYHPDYYGPMAGINKGTPSDRLLVDWYLDSEHVAACARGECGLPSTVDVEASRIEIPPDFGEMLTSDPDAALRERLRVRRSMQDAFANGCAVRGFDPASREYVLSQR